MCFSLISELYTDSTASAAELNGAESCRCLGELERGSAGEMHESHDSFKPYSFAKYTYIQSVAVPRQFSTRHLSTAYGLPRYVSRSDCFAS